MPPESRDADFHGRRLDKLKPQLASRISEYLVG